MTTFQTTVVQDWGEANVGSGAVPGEGGNGRARIRPWAKSVRQHLSSTEDRKEGKQLEGECEENLNPPPNVLLSKLEDRIHSSAFVLMTTKFRCSLVLKLLKFNC